MATQTETQVKAKRRMRFNLYAALDNAYLWRQLFRAITLLQDEVPITLYQDRVLFSVMDPSHVQLLDVVIPKHEFTEWRTKGLGRGVGVSIAVEKVNQLLYKVKPKPEQSLSIEVDTTKVKKDKPGSFIIKTVNGVERRLKIDLLNEERLRNKYGSGIHHIYKQPKFRATAKFLTITDFLRKMLEDIEARGVDKFRFHVKKGRIHGHIVLSTSDDWGERTNSFPLDDVNILRSTVAKTTTATYCLTYVKSPLKELKDVAEVVEVSFGSDLPMKLSFRINDAIDMRFDYYVAPRIED